MEFAEVAGRSTTETRRVPLSEAGRRVDRVASRNAKSPPTVSASVRHTEGAFEPKVDRVPAGHSVAPGGGLAPIPGPPRDPEEAPRGFPRDDRAAADPAVVAAVDDGVGPRGRPSRTRRPILAIRGRGATAPVRGGARASGRWASGRRRTAPSARAVGRKRSRVEGDKGIEGAGVRSGSCRVGSFARDGSGVVGPKRARLPNFRAEARTRPASPILHVLV